MVNKTLGIQTKKLVLRFVKVILLLIILLIIQKIHAQVPALSDQEVQQYYDDLGVVLSDEEKTQIAQIVKPLPPLPQWRIDANNRIEQFRKADLGIKIVDAKGNPIKDAKVRIELKRNAFNFGVVVRAEDLTDEKNRLANAGSTPEDWKKLLLALGNAVGTGNNFKPRLTSLHEYLPAFLQWTNDHDLYVRGHLLLWPGSKGIEDMDKPDNEIGVDYGRHLSNGGKESLHHIPGYENVESFDVEQAVLDYKYSNRTQADKNALEAVVDAEISQWAGLWNVMEWDVINETLSCRLLMDILGYDQMAEWFKLAEENKVNPDAVLFLNEYKIVSAPEEEASTPDYLSYTLRKDKYMERLDRIMADGGPLGGIGFQNRYTWGVPDPETSYTRLEEFGSKYGLPMVGTEFELVDNKDNGIYTYDFSEMERARVTEETLTTYYSHPLTTGLFNWTFMDEDEEKALCYYDGRIKLNGLVWYYLHKIRYHTDQQVQSDADGQCAFRAFKGKYLVNVEYKGENYQSEVSLKDNTTHQVVLTDVGTSIDEDYKGDLQLKVYPNPVFHYLFIESNLPSEEITIADLNGNILSSYPKSCSVDLSHLSRGTYFMLYRTRGSFEVRRIVKY